jgi:hypothetical protein
MKYVPDWYELVLLSLAAWRVFYLIGHDDISEGLRRRVMRVPKNWDGESPITSKSYRETLALFVQCPYCAGFWIGILWWIAWLIFPTETMYATVPFALNAGVIGAHRVLSS